MKTEIPQSFIEPVYAEGTNEPSHYVMRDPEIILLSTAETATILNTTPSAIKEWRRSGVIPYVRIKGQILFRLADVLKTIDAHTFRNDPKLPSR